MTTASEAKDLPEAKNLPHLQSGIDKASCEKNASWRSVRFLE